MATFGRREAVDFLAKELDLTMREASLLLETFIDTLVESIVEVGEVKLVDFGVFKVKQKKERLARNPKTGEPAMVSARQVVRFHASKSLNERLTLRHQG